MLETIFIFLLIVLIFFFGGKQKKYRKKNRTVNFSNIHDLTSGLVKVKGRLEAIETIKSPIFNKDCIGYECSRYLRNTFKSSGGKKWIKSWNNSYCTNFFIEDNTGKIEVNAKKISIKINCNKSEKKISKKELEEEKLLIADDKEYILIGTVVSTKNGTIKIKKGKLNKELLIMDSNLYNLLYQEVPDINSKVISFVILLLVTIISFMSIVLINDCT